MPVFYDEYATLCCSVSQNKRAVELFEEGIEVCKNIFAYYTSQLYKHYGLFLEKNNNFDAAQKNYKLGFKHAQKRKPEYMVDLVVDLSRVWKLKANEAKAEKYRVKALELVKKISPLREPRNCNFVCN